MRFTKNSQLLAVVLCLFLFSCKKDEAKSDDTSQKKHSWIKGTWVQKDLQLAYPVKFAGQNLPVGFSVYNITGYLPVSGPLLNCTKNNSYTFNNDSSYAINGCTDLMLPTAKSAGKWRLEIYDAVLRLTSSPDQTAPYWINSLTEKEWSIGLTVYIAEVDKDLPVNLLLEKQ